MIASDLKNVNDKNKWNMQSYHSISVGILACLCDKPLILSSRVIAIPLTHLLLS